MWKAVEPSYQLVIEERPGYLHATIRAAEDSYELTLTAVTEIAAICRARGASRLLVEHDIPSRLTTMEVYSIAVQLPKLYFGIVVAFVIHRSLVLEHPEFLEKVARNRGGQGQLFSNAREAEVWLRSQ